MKMNIALAPLFAIALATSAQADEVSVRKLLEPKIGAANIVSVKKSYAGLYEVVTNGEIIYTDEAARYIFAGNVIDAATKQNLTALRSDEINKFDFKSLPLKDAVKMVRGNGKRIVVIFEDPNCGYCKKFRQTLQGVDNVTVYTFMFNILSPNSVAQSRAMWCSPDRDKAWDEWMLNGRAAPAAPATCQDPNERNLALGKSLHIRGTPTIFFTDGSRIPGVVDAKGLEAKFSTITNN